MERVPGRMRGLDWVTAHHELTFKPDVRLKTKVFLFTQGLHSHFHKKRQGIPCLVAYILSILTLNKKKKLKGPKVLELSNL